MFRTFLFVLFQIIVFNDQCSVNNGHCKNALLENFKLQDVTGQRNEKMEFSSDEPFCLQKKQFIKHFFILLIIFYRKFKYRKYFCVKANKLRIAFQLVDPITNSTIAPFFLSFFLSSILRNLACILLHFSFVRPK